MESAKIVYWPHCSRCGAIIKERPRYGITENEVTSKNGDVLGILSTFVQIEPEICETCGAYFDCIEIEPPEQVK